MTASDVMTQIIAVAITACIFIVMTLLVQEFASISLLADNPNSGPILVLTEAFYTGAADRLVVFLWVGLLLVAMGSAALTPVKGIFYFFNILTSLVMIVLSVVIEIFYDRFIETPALNSIAINNYSLTNILIDHMPIFTLVSVILITTALYMGNKIRDRGYL